VTALEPSDLPVTDPPGRSGGVWRRVLLWTGVGVLGVGAAYGALVAASGDGLPRGATVLGVDVGGLSEAQATATLDKQLGPRATAPINATIGSDAVSVVPADAGLTFDAAATVDGYAQRIWNPITLITQFTGGPKIAPVIGIDQAALDASVKQLAADSDSPAQEPSVEFRGTAPVLVNGANGRVLDQKAAATAIADSYLVSSDAVRLPVVETAPTVSQEDAQKALVLAQSAVSAPVTVKVGTITAQIPSADIARALAFTPQGGQLSASLDGEVLRSSIADALAPVEEPGRDASWDVSSGTPVIVPSKVGHGVNPDNLADSVLAVLPQAGAASRVVTPVLGTIEPKLTTEQAQALGIVEQLSSFKQHFPYAAYRVQNIGTAAKFINNTLLLPGDTFSLNDTIKERTPANGYTKGFVIGPGGVFKEDLGGGVSTSATATWTAAFYAGLQRVYTQAHSIWIPRYRAGLEATVAWGSFDMKFKNDTGHGVLITTIMKNTSITVQMWGTKTYDEIRAESSARRGVVPFTTLYDDTPTCHAQSGEPGFTIDVFRIFIKDGAEVKREKITTRYRPGPTVICGADPSKTPTPSPSPSGSVTGSPKPSATASPTSTKSP